MFKRPYDAFMTGYRLIVLRSQGKYGLSPEGISGHSKRWLRAYEAGRAAACKDLGLDPSVSFD